MIVSSQEVLRGMSARSLRLFEPRGSRGVVDAEGILVEHGRALEADFAERIASLVVPGAPLTATS